MENFTIAELDTVIGEIGEVAEIFDLDRLQYFENINMEEFLNIVSSIFDIDLSLYEEDDIYVSVSGYTTKRFPKKFKRLNMERLLIFTNELAKVVIEDYQYGNLKELRKAYFVNKTIQQVLSDYSFLKESDKILLDQKLPEVDSIIYFIKNKIDGKLENVNSETLSVLESTLNELGINHKLEKQKENLIINFN